MSERIYCGEGDKCSPRCPGYIDYREPTHCKIINSILKVQKAKIKAINDGKGVE